jgi:hypothetical protein
LSPKIGENQFQVDAQTFGEDALSGADANGSFASAGGAKASLRDG